MPPPDRELVDKTSGALHRTPFREVWRSTSKLFRCIYIYTVIVIILYIGFIITCSFLTFYGKIPAGEFLGDLPLYLFVIIFLLFALVGFHRHIRGLFFRNQSRSETTPSQDTSEQTAR